jgi:hypothetical protein
LRHKHTHTCAKSKRYGDCCLKRGIRWKETLNELIESRLLSGSYYQNQQIAARRCEHFAAGGTEESLGKIFHDAHWLPPTRTCILLLHDAHFAARKLLLPVIESKVREGRCHAALAFAMVRCHFLFARPWRHGNQLTITKAEMLVRQKEWNDLVDDHIAAQDDYIAAQGSLEPRAMRDIEVAPKVNFFF